VELLNGKKALITGAGRGIGKAVTDCFLAAGAEVWGLGTKEPEDLSARIKETNGKLHWISADLGKIGEVDSVIENAVKESGGFDILVNNAGITKDGMTRKMTDEMWDAVISVNLKGVFNMTRFLGPHMEDTGTGSIINISSVVGEFGNIGPA
jgi:3-oxoacyl-[acyl-carrier protein] reductase